MTSLSESSINDKSPYRVNISGNSTISFVTDAGRQYIAGFVLDEMIKNEGIYQFFLTDESGSLGFRADAKVHDTVLAILDDFFKSGDVALVYICDTSDGRQNSRDRLFDRWYKAYPDRLKFVKSTKCIDYLGDNYYVSLLVPRKHPECEDIIRAFNEFESGLKEKLM